jgi:acetyl esterase
MPLNPQAQKFLEMLGDAPPLDTITPEENRASLAAAISSLAGPRTELASVQDLSIETGSGPVPVRVYRPSLAACLAATTYFHGGGWVAGNLDTHDAVCRDIAAASGAVVVSVEYRLAPEHPYPAPLEDCLSVTRRLLRDGAGLGVDPARIAVAGDSAGGNLAAVAAQRLPGIAHQVLIFAVLDVAGVGATGSYREFDSGYFVTQRDMAYFARSYADGHDPTDPLLSPIRAADLRGLPPATIVTAEYDPLRDENEAYARMLQAAGVPVVLRRFDGQLHPFHVLGGLIDDAIVARKWIGERLRAALT